MADPSEVGKYGTIRLLKRREPSAVVAAYPIDDEEISFGRDTNCSVRLYYPDVGPVQCRIVFEERKAFLQVIGTSGVIVDGCPVYPAKPAALEDPSTTVTVPLPNGSIFEIHKKRFMFNYPPKALRPQLFTPATARRKSIRMSLVQSALVFSPAPSPHPRENLRVLQSPLKLASAEAPVTLVDGDHPRVYEEEQDLIILEDVEPRPNVPHPETGMSPAPMRFQELPPTPQVPPKTPRRRSAPSLHRAVLIRSAQRTAYMRESQAQMQRQNVDYGPQFEEINLEEEDDNNNAEEDGEEDEEDEVVNSILNDSDEAEEDMADGETTEELSSDGAQNSGESIEVDEQDITEAQEEYREDEEQQLTTPLQVSRALQLGAFMTPQPGLFAQRPQDDRSERRKTGPQRPPPGFRFSLAPGFSGDSMGIMEENMEEESCEGTGHTVPTSPTKRPEITDEERKAILERRRSALKLPDPEIGESILSRFGKRGTSALPSPALAPASPFKTLSTHIEEGEDTQVVLRRMQVQVAERRASLSPTRPRISRDIGRGMLPPSPEKAFSLLASGTRRGSPTRGMPKFEDDIMEETQSQLGRHDSMDVDDTDKNKNQETTEENDENARPTRTQPRTPRLDGLRAMFRAPSAAAGSATPAIHGIRNLFQAPEPLQTPRMEEVRQLFSEQRVPGTPAFDGIEDMMRVDEEDEEAKDDDASGADERSAPADVPEDVSATQEPTGVQRSAPMRKLPLASRTLARSRAARPALIRMRGTPTDVSTMADDEATPDSAAVVLPKRLKAATGTPEAAVVHRTGRVRRGAAAESDTENSKATSSEQAVLDTDGQELHAKSAPRRGRPPKAKAAETEPEDVEEPPAKPASKSRARRKAGSTTAATEAGREEDTAAQPARRGTRAGSSQPEESAPSPAKRRSTRARSRSAEPEGKDNAETAAKTVAQMKMAVVETIPEEEEPVSGQVQPARKAGTAAVTRARRTRTRTESSADDAPPKKRAGPAASRRTAKTSPVESTGEDATYKDDKENTPERSPVSESGEDTSTGPAKPPSKGRAAMKNAGTSSTSKAKAALGAPGTTAKPPSRTAKVKTDEGPAVAPRATRARARK